MLHCGGKVSLPWKTSLCEAESSSDVNIQYQDKCGQMVLGGGLSAVIKEELTQTQTQTVSMIVSLYVLMIVCITLFKGKKTKKRKERK